MQFDIIRVHILQRHYMFRILKTLATCRTSPKIRLKAKKLLLFNIFVDQNTAQNATVAQKFWPYSTLMLKGLIVI